MIRDSAKKHLAITLGIEAYLADRVARHACVLDMSGESYRIKETSDWLQKKRGQMGAEAQSILLDGGDAVQDG